MTIGMLYQINYVTIGPPSIHTLYNSKKHNHIWLDFEIVIPMVVVVVVVIDQNDQFWLIAPHICTLCNSKQFDHILLTLRLLLLLLLFIKAININ